MKTICKHNTPSDLCGLCNPPMHGRPSVPAIRHSRITTLLPCPWCGSQPVVSHGNRYHCPGDTCPAGGPAHFLATKEQWNTRAPNAVAPALLEALEGLATHGHADDCLLISRAGSCCDCGLDFAHETLSKAKGELSSPTTMKTPNAIDDPRHD
jgi:hypothetical protein